MVNIDLPLVADAAVPTTVLDVDGELSSIKKCYISWALVFFFSLVILNLFLVRFKFI